MADEAAGVIGQSEDAGLFDMGYAAEREVVLGGGCESSGEGEFLLG